MGRFKRFIYLGNSTESIGKYLRYAFGEIILIFFGITLALWFDNWNDHQKKNKLQLTTLIEFSEALQSDIQSVVEDSIGCQRITKNIFLLSDILEAQQAYSSAVDTLLLSPTNYIVYSFNTSPYALLEDRGLDLIANKTLREKITRLYSYRYKYVLDVSQQDRASINAFYQQQYVKYIKYPSGNNPDKDFRILPMNYDALTRDSAMISLIRLQGWLMVRNINTINNLLIEIRSLKNDVDAEIIKMQS